MDKHPCEAYKSFFCAQRHLTFHIETLKQAVRREVTAMIHRIRYRASRITTQDVKTFSIELVFLLAIIVGIPLLIFSL